MINLVINLFYKCEYFDKLSVLQAVNKLSCSKEVSKSQIYHLTSNHFFDQFKLNLFEIFYLIKICNQSELFYSNLIKNLIRKKISNFSLKYVKFNTIVIDVDINDYLPLDSLG